MPLLLTSCGLFSYDIIEFRELTNHRPLFFKTQEYFIGAYQSINLEKCEDYLMRTLVFDKNQEDYSGILICPFSVRGLILAVAGAV